MTVTSPAIRWPEEKCLLCGIDDLNRACPRRTFAPRSLSSIISRARPPRDVTSSPAFKREWLPYAYQRRRHDYALAEPEEMLAFLAKFCRCSLRSNTNMRRQAAYMPCRPRREPSMCVSDIIIGWLSQPSRRYAHSYAAYNAFSHLCH